MINEFQQGERSGVVEEPENAKSQSQFRPKLHADFGGSKECRHGKKTGSCCLESKAFISILDSYTRRWLCTCIHVCSRTGQSESVSK